MDSTKHSIRLEWWGQKPTLICTCGAQVHHEHVVSHLRQHGQGRPARNE